MLCTEQYPSQSLRNENWPQIWSTPALVRQANKWLASSLIRIKDRQQAASHLQGGEDMSTVTRQIPALFKAQRPDLETPNY